MDTAQPSSVDTRCVAVANAIVAVVMSIHAVLLFSFHNCTISTKKRPAKKTSSKRT